MLFIVDNVESDLHHHAPIRKICTHLNTIAPFCYQSYEGKLYSYLN